MAAIDAKAIQELLVQIEALRTGIQTAGEQGRARLKGIKVQEICDDVPRDAQGEVKADDWLKKAPDEQNRIREGLLQVRDSLQLAASLDGPADPTHIMYSAYAATRHVVVWAAAGSLLTILLLLAVIARWDRATGTDSAPKIDKAVAALDELEKARTKAAQLVLAALGRVDAPQIKPVPATAKVPAPAGGSSGGAAPGAAATPPEPEPAKTATVSAAEIQPVAVENMVREAQANAIVAIRDIRKGTTDEKSVLEMVILLGALGGSIHFLRSLVMFVGNRQLKRSWLLYYTSTPITGAGLAAIVYMMMRVGLLAPQGASGNGSAIANLNLIAIYAFAALSGLFAGIALEKLADIFRAAFRSAENQQPPHKDQLTAGAAKVATGGTA